MANPHLRCGCGATDYEWTGRPLLRLFCHCDICKAFNGQDYADITLFTSKNATRPDDQVSFKKYLKSTPLSRGKCRTCRAPAVEFFDLPMMDPVIVVPTANLCHTEHQMTPSFHIFYDRRVKDVDDNLKKISGYWRSQGVATSALVKSMVLGR